VGLRDWFIGENETSLDVANRLRGQALEDAESVDVERLVELFMNASEPGVCRAAATGITTVAEQAPGELTAVVPQLLEATMRMEGLGAKQRGELATAIEAVARANPEAVIAHADLVTQSLERELEADEKPGNDVRLYEEKAAALARTVGITRNERAEPVLEKLKHHHHHEVNDAARDALRQI